MRTAEQRSSTLLRLLPAALAVAALAGCGGGMRMDVAAPSTATTASLAPKPRLAAAPVDMNGRWSFSANAGGACAMTFANGEAVGEGAIRPEGGCPGNFFTSRKWTFEDGAIVVRDHKGERLGQLTLAGPGRFQGQSAQGQSITLTR